MPNALAYFMLALWPVITIAMFRRWSMERALVWSLLGAYLFLPPPPAAFDFPLMPPLDKESLPSLATFAICTYMYGRHAALLPATWAGKLLVLTFVFSPVLTVMTNAEPVIWGQVWVKGLGFKDMAALTLLQFILILPFLMARQILATREGQRQLLMGLFVGGMIYSIPMLAEVRLSPQLNIWIYGYFQHSFEQMVRGGGFRPIVFMYHGLWVAFFAMMAFVAALALTRAADMRRKVLLVLAAVYLGAVLVLCKSLGSLLFAGLLAPLVLFLPTRAQMSIAVLIAFTAVIYPVLNADGLVPKDAILQKAAAIDAERAHSLRFRFDNEDLLMERAFEKPLFGWGSWGRNHILDPVTGAIQTVTDGRWVLVIGTFGWVGFLAEFLPLFLPIAALWWLVPRVPREEVTPYLGPLCLLLAANMLDLIPNATLTPLTWLIAGGLLGYAEHLSGKRIARPRHVPLGWRSIL